MLASISAWVSPPDTMPTFGGSLRLGYEILLDTWVSDSGLPVDTTSAAPGGWSLMIPKRMAYFSPRRDCSCLSLMT